MEIFISEHVNYNTLKKKKKKVLSHKKYREKLKVHIQEELQKDSRKEPPHPCMYLVFSI